MLPPGPSFPETRRASTDELHVTGMLSRSPDATGGRQGTIGREVRHMAGSLLEMVRGRTFDDFLFVPQFSVLERRDPSAIDLTARLTEHITLRRPIVSANMDTV